MVREERDVAVGQIHAEIGADLLELGRCRQFDACHGYLPSGNAGLVRAHADELGDEIVVAEMVGMDLAGHAALLDDQDAVGQPPNEFEILLDQHDGEARVRP